MLTVIMQYPHCLQPKIIEKKKLNKIKQSSIQYIESEILYSNLYRVDHQRLLFKIASYELMIQPVLSSLYLYWNTWRWERSSDVRSSTKPDRMYIRIFTFHTNYTIVMCHLLRTDNRFDITWYGSHLLQTDLMHSRVKCEKWKTLLFSLYLILSVTSADLFSLFLFLSAPSIRRIIHWQMW